MRRLARGRLRLQKTQMMRIFALLLAAAVPARAVETKTAAAAAAPARKAADATRAGARISRALRGRSQGRAGGAWLVGLLQRRRRRRLRQAHHRGVNRLSARRRPASRRNYDGQDPAALEGRRGQGESGGRLPGHRRSRDGRAHRRADEAAGEARKRGGDGRALQQGRVRRPLFQGDQGRPRRPLQGSERRRRSRAR